MVMEKWWECTGHTHTIHCYRGAILNVHLCITCGWKQRISLNLNICTQWQMGNQLGQVQIESSPIHTQSLDYCRSNLYVQAYACNHGYCMMHSTHNHTKHSSCPNRGTNKQITKWRQDRNVYYFDHTGQQVAEWRINTQTKLYRQSGWWSAADLL